MAEKGLPRALTAVAAEGDWKWGPPCSSVFRTCNKRGR